MPSQETADPIIRPLEWHVPDDLASHYATNFVVQHTDAEFILSFFEIVPPIVVGSEEERRAQIEKIPSVRADCVARIIVSPQRLPDFLKAIQTNLEKFLSDHPNQSGG